MMTQGERKFLMLHLLALLTAFLMKLYLATIVEGYPADISCFRSWAIYVAERGFANFYNGEIFADYPPGYIYVLYIVGKIRLALSMSYSTTAYLVLVKLPPIATDIIAAHIVYLLAKRNLSTATAFFLSALYAFNPAVIVNSSLWGQVDAVFTLCILLTLMAITKERLIEASVLFALSVLIKPQALIFTPVMAFAFMQKRSFKTIASGVTCAIAFFAIAVIPFSLNKGVFWIFHHYQKTLASYPYASLNAFNLFSLTGGNFQSDSTLFLSLQYSTWGVIFILWTVIVASYFFYKDSSPKNLSFIALFIITAVYVTTSKMHDRYLFPAMLIALLNYIHTKDRRILYIYAAISTTLFINEAYVLSLALRGSFHIPVFDSLMLTVSAINVSILICLILVGNDLVHNRVKEFENVPKFAPSTKTDDVLLPRVHKKLIGTKIFFNGVKGTGPLANGSEGRQSLPSFDNTHEFLMRPLPMPIVDFLQKRDYIIIAFFILLNTVLVFYKLGSSKAPETYWKPAAETESVAIEFENINEVSKVCFFGGIGEGQYGITYQTPPPTPPLVGQPNTGKHINAGMLKQVFVFEWRCSTVDFSANNVFVNVQKSGAMLNEIGFFDKSNNLIKIRSLKHVNPHPNSVGKVEYLIDEQKTVPNAPSYLNSTYFDEIYFARTAYEQIHGITPYYENTHPPFGKHIIAVGVALLGMNPFGWRIAGVVAAIFMIVLMYVFGRQIFDSTRYAVIVAFLMTFEFMRFVQGRIATIDIFAVCFIIMMYYFMYRYYVLNSHNRSLKETLLPLGLSGASFGVGAATKWICLYAGAGLAVVFFASLYFRYNDNLRVIEKTLLQRSKKKLTIKKETASLPITTLGFYRDTILWACLFFVIIPLIIYGFSYLPLWLSEPTRTFFDYVETSQTHMFNYHKNLVATHSFSSKWYEWPLLKRPLWMYAGQPPQLPVGIRGEGLVSSIVSMGNPAIWWLFAPVLLIVVLLWFKSRDRVLFFLLTGAAAQYLPWVAVPRLTFIYHFFASVPFLILFITYVLKWLEDRNKSLCYLTYCYLTVVFVLFVLFYPVLSGMVVSKSYVSTFLRWFESWILFS